MSTREEGRAQEEGRHQEEEGDQEEEGHQEEEGDQEEVNASRWTHHNNGDVPALGHHVNPSVFLKTTQPRKTNRRREGRMVCGGASKSRDGGVAEL